MIVNRLRFAGCVQSKAFCSGKTLSAQKSRQEEQRIGRLALIFCCLFSHAKTMHGLLSGVFWKKPDLATVMIGRSLPFDTRASSYV